MFAKPTTLGRRMLAAIPGARAIRDGLRSIQSRLQYVQEFRKYSRLAAAADLKKPTWHDRFPCLTDKTATTEFSRHYVYHTGWAARILASTRPECHVDISSSLYFASIASAFVKMEHYDYRPPNLCLDNLEVRAGDLLKLPFADETIVSLSCMHVLEHIGLGRYGDPLNSIGDVLAAKELSRVLSPSGILLFVTPVGKPRTCFNAHRIYSYDQVCRLFPDLEVEEFRLLPDDPAGGGLAAASSGVVAQQDYGCGCFKFTKRT
jgi:SAM-dependent methyltransferase